MLQILNLMQAFIDDRFEINYVPVVDPQIKQVSAYEIAVELTYEDKVYYEDDFMPILRREGMNSYYDGYIFTKVCELIKTRNRKNPDDYIKVIFALSSETLYNPIKIYDIVMEAKDDIDSGLIMFKLPVDINYLEDRNIRKVISFLNSEGFSYMIEYRGSDNDINVIENEMFRDDFNDSKLKLVEVNQIDSKQMKILNDALSTIGIKMVYTGVDSEKALKNARRDGADLVKGSFYKALKSIDELN